MTLGGSNHGGALREKIRIDPATFLDAKLILVNARKPRDGGVTRSGAKTDQFVKLVLGEKILRGLGESILEGDGYASRHRPGLSGPLGREF